MATKKKSVKKKSAKKKSKETEKPKQPQGSGSGITFIPKDWDMSLPGGYFPTQ